MRERRIVMTIVMFQTRESRRVWGMGMEKEGGRRGGEIGAVCCDGGSDELSFSILGLQWQRFIAQHLEMWD